LILRVNIAYADVPSVTDLRINVESDSRVLSISLRHSSPSSIHYVSEIEVKVGEETMVIELDPQSNVSFTEEVDIEASGDVQVRVYCTLHGWSSWGSVGSDSEPVDDTRGGIPGFQVEYILLGLVVFSFLYYTRNQ
jgi:desulfoferrodoxin (superoxide reductase-like protein)